MTRTLSVSALLWCALASMPGPAAALEDYATEIRDALELPAKPHCDTCHARDARGLAVDTPFSRALKDRGFQMRFGIRALRSALSALDEANVDSDNDGVGDVDELRAGADPNDPTDAGMPPPSCTVAPFSPHIAGLWLPLSWVLLGYARRAWTMCSSDGTGR